MSVYALYDILGLKLLTRLRLSFNHLNEHKFRRKFKHTVYLMWSCGFDRRKALNFIFSQGYCQRFSPPQTSDAPRARFEAAQNLSPGFVE